MIKDREALAALNPFDKTMMLTTLHWPDEIRSTKELELPEEEFDFKPAEKAMAKQLVAAMTGEFEPQTIGMAYRLQPIDGTWKVVDSLRIVDEAP